MFRVFVAFMVAVSAQSDAHPIYLECSLINEDGSNWIDNLTVDESRKTVTYQSLTGTMTVQAGFFADRVEFGNSVSRTVVNRTTLAIQNDLYLSGEHKHSSGRCKISKQKRMF